MSNPPVYSFGGQRIDVARGVRGSLIAGIAWAVGSAVTLLGLVAFGL